MFSYLTDSFKKIFALCSNAFTTIFSRPSIDEQSLEGLEQLLISSDAGMQNTKKIIESLRSLVKNGTISHGADLKKELKKILIDQLNKVKHTFSKNNRIFLLLGINGSGKTTLASKLAYKFISEDKKVLLVAADTFRAAAQEQLAVWANKFSIDIVGGAQASDPSSVVYKGCEQFKNNQYDIMIIDTAGRLQTKTNLMAELAKIKKNIGKFFENEHIEIIITIDSMLGQNSLDQARVFKEATQVTGVALTKMDGTGKGGIVFSIVDELKLPILFISYGEKPEQLILFNPEKYVQDLLEAN